MQFLQNMEFQALKNAEKSVHFQMLSAARRKWGHMGLAKMRPALGEEPVQNTRVHEVLTEADIPHASLSESDSESDTEHPVSSERIASRCRSIMDLKFELPTDLELGRPVLSLDSFSWTKSSARIDSFDNDLFDVQMFYQ